MPLLFDAAGAKLSVDLLIAIQRGQVPGHSIIHKFGRNIAVPSGVWAHISVRPFSVSDFLQAPQKVRIQSGGDIENTQFGLGAQSITVQGIVEGTLFEEKDIIVTNGISASLASKKSFWRVHRAFITPKKAGAYGGSNTGEIIIETDEATPVELISIAEDEGQSQYAGYTIPAGKTGYLLSSNVTVNSGKSVDVRVVTRQNIDGASSPCDPKRVALHFDGLSSTMPFTTKSPLGEILEKTDIWWECLGSAQAEKVSVDFELLLADN